VAVNAWRESLWKHGKRKDNATGAMKDTTKGRAYAVNKRPVAIGGVSDAHTAHSANARATAMSAAWGSESYIMSSRGRGAWRKFTMRIHSSPINATRHTEHRRPTAHCALCAPAATHSEDAAHILLHCPAYAPYRMPMIDAAIDAIAHLTAAVAYTQSQWAAMSDPQRVVTLLSGDGAVNGAVCQFLARAFYHRSLRVQEKTGNRRKRRGIQS
jgi:hypothetical protein